MGFDNECIVNIQSLAGEYFCPVCRLLVLPNEAMQSQCTHLYCKPCLTYVVSTTRACPYDGYLVTEADSKPLTESNKTLAETIGKIPVHCLFQRSGCTWQGTLSESTSHCYGCAFGNSPVVCNRCAVQIVHRQVQEHAQTCAGVQGQVAVAQDPSATSASASTDQTQAAAAPAGATTSQALTSQTVATNTTPGQVSNQLPNPPSQTQALAQTAVQPTAEQWYQQQQQYQQYYQQYPGQDPYQQQYQHYYPYQQSAVPQYQQAYGQPQPQSQPQPQTQLQPQPHPQPQPQPQPQVQHQSQPQAQGLSQPLSHVQAPVAPQSQKQVQVHQPPQQVQPAVQPHGQMNHPPGHSQAFPQPQTQPYPYPQQVQPHSAQPQPQQNMQMPPYQQPVPQIQHSQPQVQQPVQKYPVPQTQVHPQLQPNAPIQHLSQPQVHPHQPVTPSVQPQVPNPSSHAVTGHHSYPQSLPHQNMQPGGPQQTIHMHPQSGPQFQAQHSVQVQNQFPQQIPAMRPNQSHAMFPNQQHQTVQGQSTPSLQQQPVYTHNQQPGQISQRPILQPVQQMLPQQPFPQQHMPMPSHLRPQGPAHSFPKHAYPQSQVNTALPNSAQHSQSQNAIGRQLITNHTGNIQPFAQSANTIPVRQGNQGQLSSELLSRAPEPIERQGNVMQQQTESASGKLSKNFKDSDVVSGSANDLKSERETELKPIEGEDPHSVKTLGPNTTSLENGDSEVKNLGNESGGGMPGVQDECNDRSVVPGSETQGGAPQKTEAKLSGSETDKLHSDGTCAPRPNCADNPAPAVSQTDVSLGAPSFAQPSHPAPFADQGKHQQPMINYGPGAIQQRTSATLASQSPHPGVPNQPHPAGNLSDLQRNHGPAPLHSGQSLTSTENFQPNMFKHPQGSDVQFNTPGKSFPPQSLRPLGPYNQVHEPPFHAGASNLSRFGGPQFGAPPPGDMHGGPTANLLPHAPEGFGSQDERFKSFQNIDRREFENDLNKFPRLPLDAEPVSKFGKFPLGPHEAGKKQLGFHDDAIMKSGSNLHSGYHGLGPGYGRHHMDGMAPRSPVSEYTEMPSRRLGPLSAGLVSKSGVDDFDGRAASRFGESAGMANAFRDSRFPHLPSHLQRDEFDGFGNFRMGEHPRSGDFMGHDDFAGHFRRGEHLGPHNFPRHLQLRESVGFGAHPGHLQAVELGGSRSFDSFSKGNRPGHPQLGEPGFRSSYSLPGFPNDAGFLTGDSRSFDNLRRRKAPSMGWCRICKVDCETVEGLDLHSQTREHQKIAMDIVKSIKQNAKKLKLTPREQTSVGDGNKMRNTNFEGRGNKH